MLTAFENVLLALDLAAGSTAAIGERASECLTSVGMGSFARRLSSGLSGGEQQPVAIACALANDPRHQRNFLPVYLLLDAVALIATHLASP
jgi:ABC-type methionine transport system ATPase subunit